MNLFVAFFKKGAYNIHMNNKKTLRFLTRLTRIRNRIHGVKNLNSVATRITVFIIASGVATININIIN